MADSCDFFDEFPVKGDIRDFGEVNLQILLLAPLLFLGNITDGLSPDAPDIVTTLQRGKNRFEPLKISR